MKNTATAGNRGKSVRSDCFVSLEILNNGGIQIELQSKVKSYFEKSINKLIREELEFFDIKNAKISIKDRGALPFVLSARIEAAIKQCTDTEKEYLTDMLPENIYTTERNRFRRSRLYLPGNTPKLMINAGLHSADGIILDLEDSVAPSKKAEARFLVRNALRQNNFYAAERMVRINQIPMGLQDLKYIIPHNVNVILIPKCESAEQIHRIDEKIAELSKLHNIQPTPYLMPIIESALGVVKAYEIASASENIVALAIGLEDYTSDLGTPRTEEGNESFFARSMLVNAAKAAGIQAIDSVYSDVSNTEGLKKTIQVSKSLGFDGMGCIHPRQVKVIHENFAPTEKEIEKAQKIVNAFEEAENKGLGVVALGSKMIDPPVVKRAQQTINLAIMSGKLAKDWKEESQKNK